MRNNMKKIFIYVLVITFISLGVIAIDGIYDNIYTIKLINTENEKMVGDLSEKDINEYEGKIKNELNNELNQKFFKNKKNIKNSYYALGKIESLKKNYKQSNKYLLKAIEYMEIKNSEIDFKIYRNLAMNSINTNDDSNFKKYFEKAESIALKENLSDELSNFYFSLAKINLKFKENMCKSIALMEKAIDLEITEKTKIEEYNFLASLYRSNGQFNLSLSYAMESWKISYENKDYENMYKSIVNLGENYYVQENYKKAAYIYESILKDDNYKMNAKNLSVIGYLMESYFKIGANEKAEKLKIQYESIANELENPEKNKELVWLYMVYSNIKLEQNDLKTSKEYLDKAKKLYNENSLSTYPNSDLYFKKLEIGSRYKSDSSISYSQILGEYNELLNEIKKRGIKSDIYITVLKDIIKLSKENDDYENIIKYNQILGEYEKKSQDIESTDTIFFKLQEKIYKESQKGQNLKLLFSIILLALISILALIVAIKNSKINKLNKELEEISIKDPLTNVYNKRHFYNVLEKLSEEQKHITFIMIDIDYFKAFNDNYGHLKGDGVLIKVSKILENTFRQDYVFRYGGEEFAIVSEGNLKETLLSISILRDKLYKANIKHEFSEVSDRVTLSIGIKCGKIASKEDVEQIITDADERLYKSKTNGRNRYTCF
ncbi:GGDEF domain-containing protein [Paraclostridium bifermentans]|uniref:GGDEF domain-containing protein n=1 Tax=Paraclostridium bifermentans TaxID=1490 RepID=A0ABY8QYS5_PARBF|nr:GGDEF domain-containing protein [Paraclostridium bifermentans]